MKLSPLQKAHDIAFRYAKSVRGIAEHEAVKIHDIRFNPDVPYSVTPKLREEASRLVHIYQRPAKEFAGMLPDGYHLPAISRTKPDGPAIGTYAHPTQLYSDYQKEVKHNPSATIEGTFNLSPKQPGSSVSRLKKGGLITVPREGYFAGQIRGKGGDIPSDGRLRVLAHNGRRGVLKHEIAHSILQQKRGGAPDSIASLLKEELIGNSKQFLGKKSPVRDRPLSQRIASVVRGTVNNTKYGVETMGIKKWFEAPRISSLTHPTLGMALKNFQLPHDYATQPDSSERREFIKTGILGAGIAAGAGIGAGSDWFIRR